MINFFLVPGRLISKLLGGDKKRALRSPRQRSEASTGQVVVSLFFWVALAASIVFGLNGFVFSENPSGVGEKVAGTDKVALEAAAKAPVPPVNADKATSGGSAATAAVPPVKAVKAVKAEKLVAVEQWLVILHTIPKSGRSEAERRKERYQAKGLGVDILDTDAFPRLKSGSWIIALGPFEDRAIAYRMAEEAKRFNSGLIVRRGL